MSLVQKINLARLAVRYKDVTLKKLGHSFFRGGSSRRLEFPSLIRFFLFYGCNLRCTMCGQWRRKAEDRAAPGEGLMRIDKLREIVDEAAPYAPEVYVWGGEPTLHPDFLEFISYVKQKGLVCTVNTNGTMLKKLAPGIVASGVDSVDVSLDGPRDIHDEVRGVEGTYDRVMEGLAELGRCKTGAKPLVKAVVTLTECNLDHIEELLAEIERNSAVDMSIVQLGWFVTDKAGVLYEKRVMEQFGIEAASWKGFEDNAAPARAQKSRALVQRIKSGGYKKPVLFFPDLAAEAVERYYADHSERFGRRGCDALYREVDIRPNGDTVICGDFPDIVIGNLHQESLREIWTGEKLAKFRQNINKGGLFTICPRCCGFFR